MPNIYDNITDGPVSGSPCVTRCPISTRSMSPPAYIDLRGWSSMADILDSKPAPDVARATARGGGHGRPSDSQQLLDSLGTKCNPRVRRRHPRPRTRPWPAGTSSSRTCCNQLMRGLATTEGPGHLQTLKRQLREGVVAMKVFTETPAR